MNIKKLAHCCLTIETKKLTIVTDPGSYSIERHEKINRADLILITHEHGDHFHIESLKKMIERIPNVLIITNDAVGEMLAKEGIEHRIMKHGDVIVHEGVSIEAFGKKHAIMHKSISPVSNVGFFIDKKLFYPGDAFTDPKVTIDVLALPVAGPWLKISESIDYALKLQPRVVFPVHDAVRGASQHTFPEKILAQSGIEFIALEEDQQFEI